MTEALPLPISVPADQIAAFCVKWHVRELSLFGSVVRGDFGPDSDVDVLVRFTPDSQRTFADLDDMENELRGIFDRRVDLADKSLVESSENYIRRKEILSTARVIYDPGSGLSAGHAAGRQQGPSVLAGT